MTPIIGSPTGLRRHSEPTHLRVSIANLPADAQAGSLTLRLLGWS